ncbi:MAG: DnaJ domain-containing protein [Pseudomonadota bacterium]
MGWSLLLIALVALLIWGGKSLSKAPKEIRNKNIKNWLLIGGAVLIIGLVIAGRAPWIMGVLAALLAVAGRIAQLASFIPIFKGIFGQQEAGQSGAGQGRAPMNTEMTRAQAADVLGVDEAASEEEIKDAHKKLMQKIHPDRGGSEALAKQINKAKDILLS